MAGTEGTKINPGGEFERQPVGHVAPPPELQLAIPGVIYMA